MQKYKHRGHWTKEKMHRKIGYLRNMKKPNIEAGATGLTWRAWWHVLMKLKLVPPKPYYR